MFANVIENQGTGKIIVLHLKERKTRKKKKTSLKLSMLRKFIFSLLWDNTPLIEGVS